MAAQPQERVRKRLVWFSPFLLVVALSPAVMQFGTCSPATGDATLSALEVEVLGQDQISAFDPDHRTYNVWLPLSADTATVRAYSTDPGSQVSYNLSTEPSGDIDYGYFPMGGGEITLAGLLPEGRSTLRINVRAPGRARATYSIDIQVGCSDCDDGIECTTNACDTSVNVCVHPPEADDTACDFGGEIGTCVSGVCEMGFPCTEQGIGEAIAVGGGPHTFACSGPTTVQTQDEIVIDNDVILDCEGNLTVQGSQQYPTGYHRVFSVPAGVTAELVGMTITGGGLAAAAETWEAYGAGIFNEGTLTLTNSNVVANRQVGEGDLPPLYDVAGAGIYNTGRLTLESSTVSGNLAFGDGGGIYSTGELIVTSSLVSGNQLGPDASGTSDGAGIYSTGSLTIIDSTVAHNVGGNGGRGSGIFNQGGAVTLINSVVSEHQADSVGGGVHSTGTMLLISSTVSDNESEAEGGGVYSNGITTLVNSTVSGNYAINGGSQVVHEDGVLTLISSTLVGSSGGQSMLLLNDAEIHASNTLFLRGVNPICSSFGGGFVSVSGGGNIESSGDTCDFTDPSDLVNVSAEDVKLGPLADNGGPTMTHALLPGSVAIDQIPEADCLDADGDPLTEDQRGVARPQGGMCDVGAFEWADCSGTACDDGNDCTADHCDPSGASWCAYTTLPDGTLCGVDGVCDAGACRERSWGTPVLIETGAGDAYYPEIAVDPNGNATAVWRQDNGANWDIWANRYISGVGWNTAVVIDGAAGDAYGPEVAVDANGNSTAVWRQYSGTDWNVWSNRYTPGVGWGTAVLIENGAGEAYYPEVAVDPNGNATAVWQQYNGADWDIWANRYTAGVGWGTGLFIDSAAGEANGPEVAVDANGNATAVWQQYNGADWDIWANRYTAGVGWGGATVIENGAGGAYDARLAVDPNGNATAVWQQYNGALIDIWANRYTPGVGWGTAVVIDGAAGEAKDPQVAVDPNGNAAAVWRQYNGASNDIWANRYISGVGWNTAVLIESAAGEAYDPEIAFDPDGNATVVWEQKNGADWDIWANRYIAGVGWNTAVLIESATGSFAGGAPQIDVDPDGNATAVWGGHSSVWANRFE